MIREATIDDTEALIALSVEAHSKSPYSHIPFKDRYIRKLVVLSIYSPIMQFFVSEDDEGNIDGAISCMITENVWGGKIATDNGVFTKRPGIGYFLIKRFFRWAKSNGAKDLMMSNSYGSEKYDMLLDRIGLKSIGKIHIGEL